MQVETKNLTFQPKVVFKMHSMFYFLLQHGAKVFIKINFCTQYKHSILPTHFQDKVLEYVCFSLSFILHLQRNPRNTYFLNYYRRKKTFQNCYILLLHQCLDILAHDCFKFQTNTLRNHGRDAAH